MNSNNNANGGNMNRSIALFSVLVFGACAEEDNTITLRDAMDVVAHVATYNVEQCTGDSACFFDQRCLLDKDAPIELGRDIYTCQDACQDGLVSHVDGTITREEIDSCQRDNFTENPDNDRGNPESWFCGGDSQCHQYDAMPDDTEPVVDPEPTTPTDPTDDQFVEVSCTFGPAAMQEGIYAQLSWSTSSEEDPKGWSKDGDMTLDEEGRFVSYEPIRGAVTQGYWVELTLGTVESLDDGGNIVDAIWLGEGEDGEFRPLNCEVDGVVVPIAEDQRFSCGIGIDGAVESGGTTSDCH